MKHLNTVLNQFSFILHHGERQSHILMYVIYLSHLQRVQLISQQELHKRNEIFNEKN